MDYQYNSRIIKSNLFSKLSLRIMQLRVLVSHISTKPRKVEYQKIIFIGGRKKYSILST